MRGTLQEVAMWLRGMAEVDTYSVIIGTEVLWASDLLARRV